MITLTNPSIVAQVAKNDDGSKMIQETVIGVLTRVAELLRESDLALVDYCDEDGNIVMRWDTAEERKKFCHVLHLAAEELGVQEFIENYQSENYCGDIN